MVTAGTIVVENKTAVEIVLAEDGKYDAYYGTPPQSAACA